MKVRAVFPRGGFGFDGQGRRRHGDVFEITKDQFSENWMEAIEEDKVKASRAAAELAEIYGLDLGTVKGTGKGGAISKGDVTKALEAQERGE